MYSLRCLITSWLNYPQKLAIVVTTIATVTTILVIVVAAVAASIGDAFRTTMAAFPMATTFGDLNLCRLLVL